MAIPKNHKKNFNTLIKAIKAQEVALMECKDVKTGEPVYTICTVQRKGSDFVMIPFAKMFDGNPFEEVTPPY